MIKKIIFLCAYATSVPLYALDLEATLAWSQRMELGTLVSGVVEEVLVTVGQKVKKDDLLISLDNKLYQQQVRSAQSVLSQSRILFEETRREHDRSLELYDRALISDHEVQLTQIAKVEAETAMQVALTRLTQAKVDVSRCDIRAPFDGVVIEVKAHPVQPVNNTINIQPLVTVAQRSPMLAVTAVNSQTATKLNARQPVSVAVRGEWIKGEVHEIALEPTLVIDQEVHYTVTISFSANETIYRAGEPATIRLED